MEQSTRRTLRIVGISLLVAAQAEGLLGGFASRAPGRQEVGAPPDPAAAELLDAALVGAEDRLRAELEEGAPVDGRNQHGQTALMLAAQSRCVNCLKALLEAGADIDARDNQGRTALMAAASNHLGAVELLLAADANVNAHANSGATALTVASWGRGKDRPEIVKALLQAGAQVNARENDGETALYLAATGGQLEMVKALLKGGADVSLGTENGVTPLMGAMSDFPEKPAAKEIIELLLAAGANPNAARSDNGRPVLMSAVRKGDPEIVRILLEAGADPNGAETDFMQNTVLHIAAEKGDPVIVGMLLEAGADGNVENRFGQTPLDVAKQHGHEEIVKVLGG